MWLRVPPEPPHPHPCPLTCDSWECHTGDYTIRPRSLSGGNVAAKPNLSGRSDIHSETCFYISCPNRTIKAVRTSGASLTAQYRHHWVMFITINKVDQWSFIVSQHTAN